MLVKSTSTLAFAKKESGGKGFNLYLMSQKGLPVPEWVILGKRIYLEYLQKSGVASKIEAEVDAYKEKRITALDASVRIEKIILESSLPTETRGWIREAASNFPDVEVSVRSSAADEDSQMYSFAGQLSSFLYVKGATDIERYVKACWASAYSERALVYRLENGLNLSQVRVSVVVQRMIDPEKSGVLFTCDPIEKKIGQFLASAVYGVGEGLVSGALEADSYWIDAETGKLLKKDVPEKEAAFRRGASGECRSEALAENLRRADVLSNQELGELHRIGALIHSTYNSPQDVEWAIRDGRVYVLQTRPVTTLDQDLMGFLNLWDNSNIIESYGGLTAPLSFSFALRNYKNVYIQFCEILGVPGEITKDMDEYLGNMLGSLNGRVFYNLYNWYKLVGILPAMRIKVLVGSALSRLPSPASKSF